MYYNIKIKSNGSEFSLDSNNREITQREMDLYFAKILGASNEFVENIKKIEINNSKLVSIEAINNVNNMQTTKRAELDSNQNINTQVPKNPINTEVPRQELTKEVINQQAQYNKQLENQYVQNKPNIEVQKETLTNNLPNQNFNREIKISNAEQNSIDDILSNNKVKFENQQLPPNNETEVHTRNLDELINLAQKQLDSFDINTNVTSQTVSFQNTPSETNIVEEQPTEIQATNTDEIINFDLPVSKEEIKFDNISPKEELSRQIDNNNQTMLNSIFQDKVELNQDNPNNQELTPEKERINEINDPEISLADLEISLQPDIDIMQNETPLSIQKEELDIKQDDIQQETPSYISESVPSFIQNDTPNYMFEKPTEIETVEPTEIFAQEVAKEITEDIKSSTMGVQLDFKLFLAGFVCSNLIDEFIICAFYIKNILRQDNFTMKFINGKLFQATGNIADMSIVDELINKEYIKVINIDESRRYCITPDGEAYFANNFQG